MTTKPAEKPPLGIMSEPLWQETRMWELISALCRHREAQVSYPLEWIGELSVRSAEVFKRLKDE